MNNLPYNEYLLVMPSGDCIGFNDLGSAKAYINSYYQRKIDSSISKDGYNDATEIGSEETMRSTCTQLGVKEGKCELYNIEDFIGKIKQKVVFDDEKEEIISKLMQEKLELNIYDYRLDEVLIDIESIEVMENYGEGY